MSRLQDKVAVITGGAGGIGLAAATKFVAEGAKVLLVDLDEAALTEATHELGDAAAWCVADVSDPEGTQSYVRAAVEAFGGIDILLANAGIEGQVKPIVDQDIEMFDKVIAVNVRGVWLSLKYAIPEIAKRGGGFHRHHFQRRRHPWFARGFAVRHQQARRHWHDAVGRTRVRSAQYSGEHGESFAGRDADDALTRGGNSTRRRANSARIHRQLNPHGSLRRTRRRRQPDVFPGWHRSRVPHRRRLHGRWRDLGPLTHHCPRRTQSESGRGEARRGGAPAAAVLQQLLLERSSALAADLFEAATFRPG